MGNRSVFRLLAVCLAAAPVAACGGLHSKAKINQSAKGPAGTAKKPAGAPSAGGAVTSDAAASQHVRSGDASGAGNDPAVTADSATKSAAPAAAAAPGQAAGGFPAVYAVVNTGSAVYVGTALGLYASSDNGATFKNVTTGAAQPMYHVTHVATEGGKVYVVYGSHAAPTAGQLYQPNLNVGLAVSADQGATFTSLGFPAAPGVISRLLVQGGTIYLATTAGLQVSSDAGKTFVLRTRADGLGAVVTGDVAAASGTLFVGTGDAAGLAGSGGVATSTDGVHFTNTVLTAVTANYNLGLSQFTGIYAAATKVFGAYAITALTSQAGLGSGLVVSTDGGAHYAPVNLPANAAPYAIAGAGDIVVATSVYSNGVMLSTDAGLTFTVATSAIAAYGGPDCLHIDGNTIFVCSGSAHDRHQLTVSRDGGATFTTVTFTDVPACRVEDPPAGTHEAVCR